MGEIKYGFISTHKGGQHTNGPDYGTVTAEHEVAGVRVEIQTSRRLDPHKARALAGTLVEMAIAEITHDR
nr:hypothetical protein [Enterobacter roggenkampii]